MKNYHPVFVYLLTFYNVIDWDRIISRKIGLKKTIVRPSKFGLYFLKYPFLFVVWKLFLGIWLFVCPFLIFFQYIKALIVYFVHKKKKFSGNKLFLLFTYLLPKRSVYAGFDINAEFWLNRPYQTFHSQIDAKLQLSVFDFLKFSSLFRCLMYSLKTIFPLVRHFELQNLFYISQTFQWYMVWEALANLPKEIELYFGNQKDRWAVLFDKCKQEYKTLIQHGIEDENDIGLIRLNYINEIYAFNPKEASRLIHSCLKNSPLVHYFTSNLKLSFIEGQKFNLLIIGYCDGYFEQEKTLISCLQNTGINILLKPHPIAGKMLYYDLLKNYSFTIIQDTIFPDADIIISYYSTLAVEYENCGKKVLYYQDYTIHDLVQEILILKDK